MNEAKLDIRLVLRVFNAVRDHGEKRNDAYFWQGMTVTSDYDGYTLELTDGHCQLTVRFHNRYSFESPNSLLREQFVDQLKLIDSLK